MFHVKWVAKIALVTAMVAAAGLLLAIFVVTDDKGTGYAGIILTHNLTRQNLVPVMLVFSLLTVVLASISTWFIALYSSFRIAGPLFRFAQNLKDIIKDSLAVPMAIRRTDMLQHEWSEFETSQTRLREHYASLREAIEHCREVLEFSDGTDATSLQRALSQLQEVERRVQL